MFKLVVVGTVVALASATHPINEEIFTTIKKSTSSWIAHKPEENPLNKYTKEELLSLLGTKISESNEFSDYESLNVSAPASFDARTQWGSKIHPIRDQGQCGSCWAFGATEALSDRFAIKGIDVILSPQDMVSCDRSDSGCNGGYMSAAWSYLKSTGAVSDKCMPYKSSSGTAPSCTTKCADGSAWKKYKCSDVLHPTSVSDIKAEISTNGPVEGAFTVYEDFFSYKSGVYHHVSGGVAGGHAIKVLGYGTDNGVNYWLCANSWGANWGEKGYFRIKQGDCNIDNQMYACHPNVASVYF
jgi:cathepsin B